MRLKQQGFALVELVIVLVILAVVGVVGYMVIGRTKSNEKITSSNAEQVAKKSEVKIKHLGVNLGYYDAATNKAGDFEFTKAKFEPGMEMLFQEYGYVMPGNSATGGREKANPQPTFILPLGTKVHAIVDGTVYDVPKLYSNDYSVQMQAEGSDLIFEMEHVINVKVKKGDKLKAGDVVAEVSDYSKQGYGGMGLVEIGILRGGNPPSHICPFDYLDDSIKDDTLKKITALKKAWEEYRGNSSIYDESKVIVPGCISREPIEG